MNKRTKIDFSKHEYSISKPDGDVAIYELKLPNTCVHQFTFINARGILAVTGDYGNWIFCREFHPSKKEFASDYYWLEKLKIGSCQQGEVFDDEKTAQHIQEKLDGLEEYGYSDNDIEDVKKYFQKCLEYNERTHHEYTEFAYHNYPDCLCSEDVIDSYSITYRMFYILDAFDEMCRREK